MDENDWIGTAWDDNLCNWPKQNLWCMKLACDLRNHELLNFCFRTEPLSSALLSFDSNISTTIGRRISWLGSFEASFQDKILNYHGSHCDLRCEWRYWIFGSVLDHFHRHCYLLTLISQQPLVGEFCSWAHSKRLFKTKILSYHGSHCDLRCEWGPKK